ncbi:MAG: GlcNAc transferase, partial [Rhodopirellula bahusiensis]
AGDPATKRAIDRSREILAQLNPGMGASPAANIASAGTPGKDIGAAAGPVATVASAPAHIANQTPPSYAAPPSYAIPGAIQPSTQQPVVPGSNTAVSYQDPSVTKPAESPKAETAKPEETAPATEPKKSTPPMNFSLPE